MQPILRVDCEEMMVFRVFDPLRAQYHGRAPRREGLSRFLAGSGKVRRVASLRALIMSLPRN